MSNPGHDILLLLLGDVLGAADVVDTGVVIFVRGLAGVRTGRLVAHGLFISLLTNENGAC